MMMLGERREANPNPDSAHPEEGEPIANEDEFPF